MTFDQMYESMVAQNPALKSGSKIHLAPANFKKALQVAYARGYEEGEVYGRIARSLEEAEKEKTEKT